MSGSFSIVCLYYLKIWENEKKITIEGLRDGSVVKSVYFSCTKPEFCSWYPLQAAPTSCNFMARASNTTDTCIHMHIPYSVEHSFTL